MPLRIIAEGPYFAPRVVCDQCGQVITHAEDATYEFRLDAISDHVGVPVYFTHKQCSQAFRHENPGPWGWTPLQCLPVFLGTNLELDWKEARRAARTFSRL